MNRNTLAAIHAIEQVADTLRANKSTKAESAALASGIQRLRDSLGRPAAFLTENEVEPTQHQSVKLLKR